MSIRPPNESNEEQKVYGYIDIGVAKRYRNQRNFSKTGQANIHVAVAVATRATATTKKRRPNRLKRLQSEDV